MVSSTQISFQSASTSACAFYLLATNPEVQKKLHMETLKLLPNKTDPITPDILKKALYTKAVIKETLRLHPVSVGVARLVQEDMVLSGYKIPKGVSDYLYENLSLIKMPQPFSNVFVI